MCKPKIICAGLRVARDSDHRRSRAHRANQSISTCTKFLGDEQHNLMIFVMYFVSLSACVFELVLVKQMQRNASESKAQRRRRTVPATALADLDESTCIRNTMKYMYWRILFEMCWPPVVYVVKCCCETCLHAMCLLSHLQKERVLRRSSQIPFRNNWNGNWGFLAILICHHSVCVCVPVHVNINVNITRRPLCLRHGTLQNQAANYLI